MKQSSHRANLDKSEFSAVPAGLVLPGTRPSTTCWAILSRPGKPGLILMHGDGRERSVNHRGLDFCGARWSMLGSVKRLEEIILTMPTFCLRLVTRRPVGHAAMTVLLAVAVVTSPIFLPAIGVAQQPSRVPPASLLQRSCAPGSSEEAGSGGRSARRPIDPAASGSSWRQCE